MKSHEYHHGPHARQEQSPGYHEDGVAVTSPVTAENSRLALSSPRSSLKRKHPEGAPGNEIPSRKRGQKQEGCTEDLRFGCHLSKHNPARYVKVFGRGCTNPPGMEPRLGKTHLTRVHSCLYKEETKCRFCGQDWRSSHIARDARLKELESHLPECPSTKDQQLAQPEYLTRAQEDALEAFDNKPYRAQSRAQWHNQFLKLYPGEDIPSPDYNYFTPTHLITTVPAGLDAGPLAGLHSTPHGQSSVASNRYTHSAVEGLVGQARNLGGPFPQLTAQDPNSAQHNVSWPYDPEWPLQPTAPAEAFEFPWSNDNSLTIDPALLDVSANVGV